MTLCSSLVVVDQSDFAFRGFVRWRYGKDGRTDGRDG